MDEQLKSNLLSGAHWFRLVYMVLFAIIVEVAASVMWVVIVIQFFFTLFSGRKNAKIAGFSAALATYILQCWQFLNYNTEEKPFPFQDWPESTEKSR